MQVSDLSMPCSRPCMCKEKGDCGCLLFPLFPFDNTSSLRLLPGLLLVAKEEMNYQRSHPRIAVVRDMSTLKFAGPNRNRTGHRSFDWRFRTGPQSISGTSHKAQTLPCAPFTNKPLQRYILRLMRRGRRKWRFLWLCSLRVFCTSSG